LAGHCLLSQQGMNKLIFCEFTFAFSLFSLTQEMLLPSRATLLLNFLFFVLCYIPEAPIHPFSVGFPFFVMLNNMTSHVYRNLRFGFYQDHSITSSAVSEVSQHRHELVFDHRTSTRSEGKLEAGDNTTKYQEV
jgi:hypothetical protein